NRGLRNPQQSICQLSRFLSLPTQVLITAHFICPIEQQRRNHTLLYKLRESASDLAVALS
ncbi:MAG: hypothetical protein ACKO2T_03055, partial [Microcystis aeruginosa]